jgi:hypothetical protein
MRRETCEEKEQRHGNREREKEMHEDRGRNPKERDPFPLMSKGESEKH